MRRVALAAYSLFCATWVWGSEHSPGVVIDVCKDLANYIRLEALQIEDRPDTLIEVLAGRSDGFIRLDDNSTERAAVTLNRLHATPELLAAIRAAFGDQFETEFPSAWISWLQDDVGAVQAQFGHIGCTVLVFFDASRGQIYLVPPPPGMSFGASDLCGIPTWVGSIKNAPVVIEEEDSADLSKARLTVIPWQRQKKWGKICAIETTFSVAIAKRFNASTAFCRPQADCRRLFGMMHDFTQAHLIEVRAETTKSSEALTTRAVNTSHIFEMPTFGRRAPGLNFRHRTLYDLSLDGKPYVAIVGWDPSWNYGMLAALWQASSDHLEPVASFEFSWARGKTKGVETEMLAVYEKPIAPSGP